MRYQISGKQIDIGEALQTHVKTEVDTLIEKYHSRPTDALVVFSKSGSEYVCESVIHLSSGLTVQSRGRAHEIYAAFDDSVEKMDKQLRRYKRRLKDHHRDRENPVEMIGGASYILAADADSDEGEPRNAPADDHRRDGNDHSVIVGRRSSNADGAGRCTRAGFPERKDKRGQRRLSPR